MTDIAPGWYKDPAEPATQRYWDGGGWVGAALPAEITPPPGPPPPSAPPDAPPAADAVPEPAVVPLPPGGTIPPAWVYPYRRPAPAPMPHGLPLAAPGARLIARLVDIAVVAGLALVANAWFLYQFVLEISAIYSQVQNTLRPEISAETRTRTNNLFWLMLVVTVVIWVVYEVPAVANTGQTLGKRLLGIKVMRLESDSRLGFGRSFGRWTTLGLPTLLWPCFGVGFVLQFFDCLFVVTDRPLGQALHDKRSHTVVVTIGRRRQGGTS